LFKALVTAQSITFTIKSLPSERISSDLNS
jgi:hypothetical protein